MSPIYVPGKVVLRQQYVPLDASYSSVSLLLHGDGPSGSTVIVDNSPSPKTVTAVGNAQISTAQSKFGGASLLFDGNGDYLQIASDSALNLTADFTVEFFNRCALQAAPYPSAIASATNVWGIGAVSFHIDHQASLGKASLYANGNETPLLTSTANICDNAWHHVAFTKSGSTWRLFVDGILEATNTTRTDTLSLNASGTRIGWDGWNGANGYYNGYIDDLRITKGVARYTSNFTPPTEPFPNGVNG